MFGIFWPWWYTQIDFGTVPVQEAVSECSFPLHYYQLYCTYASVVNAAVLLQTSTQAHQHTIPNDRKEKDKTIMESKETDSWPQLLQKALCLCSP